MICAAWGHQFIVENFAMMLQMLAQQLQMVETQCIKML